MTDVSTARADLTERLQARIRRQARGADLGEGLARGRT